MLTCNSYQERLWHFLQAITSQLSLNTDLICSLTTSGVKSALRYAKMTLDVVRLFLLLTAFDT